MFWVKILLAVAALCFLVGLFGCAPGVQTTAYATALNGAWEPEPPIAYVPFTPSYYPVGQPWRSQYVVPRETCVWQGNLETCRPI